MIRQIQIFVCFISMFFFLSISQNVMAADNQIPVGQTEIPVGQTERPVEQTEIPVGQTEIPVGQTEIPVGQTEIPVGQTEIPVGQTEIPVGQTEEVVPGEEERVDADIFGKRGGHFHPFLFFEERYTDNLYNTESNEQDDFITSIAPGIWIALPSNREKLLDIGTTTTSPGGLEISRIKPETTRRYQSYLLYSPEFVYYSDHSEHDCTNHKAEGLFQYNFNMGLSLDFVDQFNVRHQANNNGISEHLDKYQDNLFNVLAIYDRSGKFRFRLDYSNYDLDYDDAINDYMDRNDNSFSVYIFYRIKPKTSLFVEYEFSDIDFDTYSDSDSVENRYYAGVQWDVTAKTKGRIKLGFLDKDFDKAWMEDQAGFSFEIQTQHNFTPKRALQINGFQRFNESNLIGSSCFLTKGLTAAWLQRFSEKWSGTLTGSFTNDEYEGEFTYAGVTEKREDDTFYIAPSLRYEFRDWMTFDLAYIYTIRDSNFNIFDFVNNTIFLRMNISL
ncbi:MAG: outer membrane beta-barrel protein [Thermodesulfobacteriota bacterium]|nr:outer membrane beta-barrel protein [Thermodesulfobacteriota bacterium]